MDELIAHREPFSVLLFDIDGFGNYHARYGATVGDDALHELTRAAAARLGGHGIFRLDGDHLFVVLADATAPHALQCADDLRRAVDRTLLARRLPALTLSFGVVEASRGTSAERVFYGVHDALYNARARGNASTVLGLDSAVAYE